MASPHLRGLTRPKPKAQDTGKDLGKGTATFAAKEHMQQAERAAHHPGSGVGTDHASQHGTQPHPSTGVHAVHMHHMGDGRYQTHTHHDGGNIETRDHNSAQEAHDHAQSQLPADGGSTHGEPDGDEYAANAGSSSEAPSDNYPGSMGRMS